MDVEVAEESLAEGVSICAGFAWSGRPIGSGRTPGHPFVGSRSQRQVRTGGEKKDRGAESEDRSLHVSMMSPLAAIATGGAPQGDAIHSDRSSVGVHRLPQLLLS